MGTNTDRKKLENVSIVTNSWSDHYESGVSYGLDVNGVYVSLDDINAEKIMLAAGYGQVVWKIDWEKVGKDLGHKSAIKPLIKGMKSARGVTTYDSKEEAEAAVNKELQSRIDALKKLGGF